MKSAHGMTIGRALALGALGVGMLLSGCSGNGTTDTGTGNGDGSTRLDGTANGDSTNNTMDGLIVEDVFFPSDGPIQVREGGIVVMEDGGSRVCHITSCAGHVLECGDCVDNDGDGQFDSHDPECLGPCDNTERADLLTGVGGENGGPCQSDCYFDFGNGPGNDHCEWDHRCDPLAVGPTFPPEGAACPFEMSRVGGSNCPNTQPPECLSFCGPLTPNGCDCFGCCTFPGLEHSGPGGGAGYVWLGSVEADGRTGSCTLRQINNPAACHVCTPVRSCLNECGACEICIGRPTPGPECNPPPPDAGPRPDGAAPFDSGPRPDAGTSMQCASGIVPCGLPGQPECAFGSYCITGCCQVAPP